MCVRSIRRLVLLDADVWLMLNVMRTDVGSEFAALAARALIS